MSWAKIEELPDGGLRLGALARNADTAEHPLVRQRYPMLAQAILAGASPQLRNMATNGGNLLQRTRCYYFYDPAYEQCNKRKPGSGCAALHGYNRIHAILGTSPSCIATHPSDMCVALAALGAVVKVHGRRGPRSIPFAEFHRLPGNSPQIDTNLRPDELILSIDLPKSPYAEHSTYIKVRDRAQLCFRAGFSGGGTGARWSHDSHRPARVGRRRAQTLARRSKWKPRWSVSRRTEASYQAAAEQAACRSQDLPIQCVQGGAGERDNRARVYAGRWNHTESTMHDIASGSPSPASTAELKLPVRQNMRLSFKVPQLCVCNNGHQHHS